MFYGNPGTAFNMQSLWPMLQQMLMRQAQAGTPGQSASAALPPPLGAPPPGQGAAPTSVPGQSASAVLPPPIGVNPMETQAYWIKQLMQPDQAQRMADTIRRANAAIAVGPPVPYQRPQMP